MNPEYILSDAFPRGLSHQAIKKILEANEVHIDCTDKLGNTALLLAAEKGDDYIVRLLIDHGARVKL